MSDDSDGTFRAAKNRNFATTRWSMIQQAQRPDSPAAASALEELCKTYWFPLYTYVRSQGYEANTAADLTQAFFADLLERDDLAAVEPVLGKFRSFLLAAINNFIKNQYQRNQALKRGGGRNILSLDFRDADQRYQLEPFHLDVPESNFQKQWARTLLEVVKTKLRSEFSVKGKAHQFEKLNGFLAGKNPDSTLAEVAVQLGISEIAVKVAVHRMRNRFGALLREEIAQTVGPNDDVESEIQQLFEILKN